MRTVTLGEVTERVRTWSPSSEPDTEFTYIDLSSVDNLAKVISGGSQLMGQDAPSRARQLVQTGDVLVSTVRPNLNAIAAVGFDLDGATASTGFSVLRPSSRVDARYLYHWVRSKPFVADMVGKATGASYPAVSDRIVKESLMPFPPLDEQRRIAAILDHADALCAKRRQVDRRLAELTQSIFIEMFGNPDEAVASGRSVRFGEVADLRGGRNLVADDEQLATPYRVLKISAVTTGVFKPSETKPLPLGYEPPVEHLVRRGDLLISRANTTELVGAVAYVDDVPPNLALPDKIWRFAWRNPASVLRREFVEDMNRVVRRSRRRSWSS